MSRPWIVLKFGGTSVASAEYWAAIAERVREHRAQRRVWIVASALSGVTTELEQAIEAAVAGHTGGIAESRRRHEALAAELGLDQTSLDVALQPLDELLVGEDVKIAGGLVYVDGVLLAEDYTQGTKDAAEKEWFNGPDEYFLLGDNRADSNDSRAFGPVSGESIRGRAWFRCWPPLRWRPLGRS